MVLEDIERLRVQGFTVARRGYDQREVDKFIAALVEWFDTDAAKDLGDVAVKRKLELVGKSTAQILLATEKESEQLRAQAEEECSELISQAEAASREARRAADEYAKQVREKADQDARQTREAASAKAKRIAEEGERRRAQIEALIAELDVRREDALGELERLRDELTATIGEHGEHGRGARAPETVAKP
jgi:cell division septum initiation protein DivIVA